VPYTLIAAAGYSLLLGWARPAPWLLALLLLGGLSVVWAEAFVRHARTGHLIVDD
jgi:hypothetical protein